MYLLRLQRRRIIYRQIRNGCKKLGQLFKIVLLLLFVSNSAYADNNAAAQYCLEKYGYKKENFDNFNFSKSAACMHNIISAKQKEEMDELRDFLKHNPRYRAPGQSLNRCWGKPREMPFESAYIKQTPGGFEAGVNYKDKLPAGCYENAPWDNRDKK